MKRKETKIKKAKVNEELEVALKLTTAFVIRVAVGPRLARAFRFIVDHFTDGTDTTQFAFFLCAVSFGRCYFDLTSQ